jgi:hypothetical protein
MKVAEPGLTPVPTSPCPSNIPTAPFCAKTVSLWKKIVKKIANGSNAVEKIFLINF